ncbi:ATP-binding protein [Sorangium sp. So ce1078]|uniref:sensor histidine kinase n=1 Tax=Sorangium sp. So ce1078 TaxID=3133329 RepID=UPI003F5F3DD2
MGFTSLPAPALSPARRLFTPSLRVAIPVVVALLTAAISLPSLWYSMRSAVHRAHAERGATLLFRLTALESTLEYLLRVGDIEQVRAEVAALGAAPDNRIAAVVDDQGVVLATNHVRFRGQSIELVWHSFDRAALDEARRTRIGAVHVLPDERRIVAYHPILLPPAAHEIRPTRVGALVVEEDLTRLNALAASDGRRAAMRSIVPIAAGTGIVWLLGGLVLTRRVRRLVTTAQRLAAGDLAARSELCGGDELARIGRAFDEMAAQIAQSRERLEASERRILLLLDSTAEGIYGVDQAGCCAFCNAAAARLLGFERPEQLIGRTLHPLDRRPAGERAPSSPRSQVHSDSEVMARADGSLVPVEYWPYPICGESELRSVVTFVDITERKWVEAERQRLYEEAQRAVRARDDFVVIASHELRTPVTALLLQAQSMQRALAREPTIDSAGRRLQQIAAHAQRLADLVENLLDVSCLAEGRVELRRESADLAEIARDIAARSAEQLRGARCPLELRADEPAVGRWDRVRLEQVVSNLVSNAAKYGAGQPIEVVVGRSQGTAWIEVRDHGIGIPQEAQARIFERFERAASTKHFSGFGLGLWITRQIVMQLGGQISVQSEPGRGTVFRVELPVDDGVERAGAPCAAATTPAPSPRAPSRASRAGATR